ncbi:MAG TPA: ATP-binding protein [Anaerolineales bacterium]|nr:ATP-binding protein [Anaerolineales bacterium]
MRSITVKLLLAFLAISMLSVLLIVLSARWLTEREFRSYLFTQNRNNIVTALANYYSKNGTWQGIDETMLAPGNMPPLRMTSGAGRFFTLVDNTGHVVLAGIGDNVGDLLPPSDVQRGTPVKVNGKVVGTLVTRQPTVFVNPAETEFLNRVWQVYTFSAIGVIALGLLSAFLLSRTLTRPIRELTAATHAMASGQLKQEVPVRSRDELGELAVSFNRMNAEMVRSTELRRQMTADIAHELRTPVSIIMGHAEAVHDGVMEPSLESFEIVRDEVERLDGLIEDLRTLSRADAGELPMEFQMISPARLLEKVQTMHKQHAGSKNIVIELQLEPDLPEISADFGRMVQVLSNLVDNALLYTPEGGRVCLSARVVGGALEIRTQDSGPGIEEKELRLVFERFYRSDPSRQRNAGGSGLGLAIAKSIVERHAGRIWAESKPGDGTTIVVQLPIPE